nr:sodium ion-translocating decarboxylase subunit beta [Paludibacteraceae bacterium]
MIQQDNLLSFLLNSINKIILSTGFANVEIGNIIMIIVGIMFIYLAIKKEWEPMLLVPIGFGMIVG